MFVRHPAPECNLIHYQSEQSGPCDKHKIILMISFFSFVMLFSFSRRCFTLKAVWKSFNAVKVSAF